MTTVVLQNASDSFTLERASATNYNASTVLYTRTLTGEGCRSYLYFGIPFPKGVTILSAKLRLYQYAVTVGSATNVVQRIGSSWSVSKVTWATGPAVTGATVSLTKSSPAAKTLWEFDVTALLQTIANGATWYGFRVINTASVLTSFFSAQSAIVAMRPSLEITWSDVPLAPTQLYPSNGRAVSTSKPTVQCNFVDLAGDTTMSGINVQVNATDVWTSPSFDSGDVATNVPELDLSTTAFAGVGAGSTVYWRVRVKDGAGLWSNWSASASFAYQTQGTLTVNNPTFSESARNAVKNPRAATVITGWVNGVGTGGTAALTQVGTGGPLADSPSFARLTWSVSSSGYGSFIGAGATTTGTYAMAVVPNEVWSISGYLRSSWAGSFSLKLRYYTSAGVFISESTSSNVSPPNGTWTRYLLENLVVPATAAFAIPVIYHSAGSFPSAGATMDVTALLAAKISSLSALLPYWDGDMVDNSEFDFSWSGAAHSSDSVLKQPVVEDATPLISWSLAGRTQASFEIQVFYMVPVLYRIDSLAMAKRLKWTSGKINDVATTYTIPEGVITDNSTKYEIVVRVWDTIVREAVPGFPISVEVSRIFYLTGTTATTPVTGLSSILDTSYPWVTLTWSRTSMPDKWYITRDNQVIGVFQGSDLFVSGTSYTYIDRRATPRQPNVYAVVPVVNGRGSSANPTTSQTPKVSTTLLSDVEGNYPVLLYSSDKDLRMDDDAFVFEPSGNAPPIVIFSATVNGYRGTVKGTLDASIQSLTTAQIRQRFEILAGAKGQKLLLTMVDQTMEVFILNPVIKPRSVDGGSLILYEVSFDFYQTDVIV